MPTGTTWSAFPARACFVRGAKAAPFGRKREALGASRRALFSTQTFGLRLKDKAAHSLRPPVFAKHDKNQINAGGVMQQP